MAIIEAGDPQEQGERLVPPVSKYGAFIANYLDQEQKSPTAVAAENFEITADKSIDRSPAIDEDTRVFRNKEIPNLDVPKGTPFNTADVIMSNQMKKNLNTAIVNNPKDDNLLSWAGFIAGGLQREVFDPSRIAAFGAAGVAGKGVLGGMQLIENSLLPESSALAKFIPKFFKQVIGSAATGGVYGFIDGMVGGATRARNNEITKGIHADSLQIVRGAIDEGVVTGGLAIGGEVAAKGIAKGFGLLKGNFKENPDMEEELARRETKEEKDKFEDRLKSIKENHIKAATENVKQGQQSVDNAFEAADKSITQFQIGRPENIKINELSETLRTLKNENVPVNEKVQGLMMVRKELSELSAQNDDILGKRTLVDKTLGPKLSEQFPRAADLKENKVGPLFEIDKHIDNYLRSLSASTNSEDMGSLTQILSDFRMVSPDDHVNLTKVAIAQMENGRAVDVEPYVSEIVHQNSRRLRDQLAQTGINRGRVLHAILDSLDVIKDREKDIGERLELAKNTLKETKDPEERSFVKGVINGRTALQTAVVRQRAVHEVLATAIADGFERPSGDSIAAYLQNQVSPDAEMFGGYDKLWQDLHGEPIDKTLARLEEKPEAFTPESREDIENLNARKSLVPEILKDAFKCVVGG